MTKRKSYHPFKMRGSWVGALVGYIASMIDVSLDAGGFPDVLTDLLFTAEMFVYIPIGFLLGWGIHSLLRKSKW